MEPGVTLSGQVVTVYAAVSPQDTMEGRGPLIDRSYHLSATDALVASKGIGVQGGDGVVLQRLAVKLTDDLYFLLPAETFTINTDVEAKARLREKVLAKLSPAEKAALGFK
jgi:hypothetical protein